jgi:hypothetical protein
MDLNPLNWRKMTWVLGIWNTIFLIWIVGGVHSNNVQTAKDCAHDQVLSQQACTTASNVGTGIGVALILMLWFIGFIVISLVWFMTRPRHRVCQVCGSDVKKGRTVCKSCGFDFAAAALPVAQPVGSDA